MHIERLSHDSDPPPAIVDEDDTHGVLAAPVRPQSDETPLGNL
jgi:hypothetical protein